MTCDSPRAASLGVPTVRRLARFTTSGGRLRFVVKALPTGSILGEISDTEVQLGDIDNPKETRYRVTASRQRPGTIDVEAGTYWVLNTNRGEIDVEVCPDVTISDVEAAHEDPEHGANLTPSTTPSTSAGSSKGTPGTSSSGR